MRTKVGKIDLRKEMKESEKKQGTNHSLLKKKVLKHDKRFFFLSVLAEY